MHMHVSWLSTFLYRRKLVGSYAVALFRVLVCVRVTLLAHVYITCDVYVMYTCARHMCTSHVYIMSGISESAGVAVAMFVVHVATLTVVCVMSAFYAFFNVNTLQDNLKQV